MAERRTAMVTGAYGAIGEAIARGLAARPELRVVLACRDADRADAARRRIVEATGNDAVSVELVDLGSRSSIDALASRFESPLDVLVNNAATTPRDRQTNAEGVELQLAVNVLGYTRMIDRFADALARGTRPRVVNVASYWAGDLELDDLQFERRRYDNNTAYRQSKQANRMLTVAYAARLAERGVAVNACHPGDVNSKLSNALGFGGHQSPDEGAATPLFLALSAEGHEKTGKYFAHGREARCEFASDAAAIEALDEARRGFG